jgi:RNA polymerase sigma-70 factor (ECF subfamily)
VLDGCVSEGARMAEEGFLQGAGPTVPVRPSAAVPAGHKVRSAARYSSPEALFSSQNDSLVRALTFVCGDRAVAEDSIQEAFARLLIAWDRVSAYDDPATWVRRVAINLAQDHRRFILRRARLLVRLGRRPKVLTYSLQGDPQLWDAVRGLPQRQRTALALYYLGDLKVAEVAATMKVSEGTVKGHLDRARQTLREKLETNHEL